MTIANKLKELRAKDKRTITECASAIGVSASTYRDWEYGRSITGGPYQRIVTFFGVSLSELFGGSEHKLSLELDIIETRLVELLADI